MKTRAYPLKLETLHKFQSGDQPSVVLIYLYARSIFRTVPV